MSFHWAPIFNTSDAGGWTALGKQQAIPKHLWSAHRGPKAKASVVGLGLVRAVVKLLRGEVRFARSSDAFAVQYTGTAGLQLASSDLSAGRSWCLPSPTAVVYLALAEAWWHNAPELSELHTRWLNFAAGLRTVTLRPSGWYDDRDLLTLAQQSHGINETLMALTDSLYRSVESLDWLEVATPNLTNNAFAEDMSILDAPSNMPIGAIPNAPVFTSSAAPSSSLIDRLERVIRRGEKALLVGPSGTFKTESAKQAAINTGRALVVIQGRPGLEDRDLFQGFANTGSGFVAVDGPLARAFRLAASQRVTLIVNELLRFEPVHLSALVGALDTYTPSELWAMGVTPVHDQLRHYLLEMPTGERLACPTQNLSIITTTNLGDDYQQLGQTIDAALLRRLGLVIDVPEADLRIVTRIYIEAGAPGDAVAALISLEERTRSEVAPNGLLVRAANPGVMLTLIGEAGSLVAEGLTWRAALEEAARVTVVPYCCPRDARGALEIAAVSALERDLKVLFRTVRG